MSLRPRPGSETRKQEANNFKSLKKETYKLNAKGTKFSQPLVWLFCLETLSQLSIDAYKGSQFGFFGSLPALGYEDFTHKNQQKHKTIKLFFPIAGRGGLDRWTSATPRPSLQTTVFLLALSNENLN